MTLIYPNDYAIIDTHTDVQNQFIDLIKNQGISAALDWLLPQKNGRELTIPKSVRFIWTSRVMPEYVFELAENDTFSPSYTVRTADTFLDVSNLKIGQKYYWRVNGGDSFGEKAEDFLLECNVKQSTIEKIRRIL